MHRYDLFIRTFIILIIGGIPMDWSQPLVQSMPVFGERILPSSLPHRLHWRSWLNCLGINRAGWMDALGLCLIRGHDEDLPTLAYPLHLHTDMILTICDCVDPIVEQESLIRERAQSPFLGLNSE